MAFILRLKPDRKWLIVAVRIQAVRCVSMSRPHYQLHQQFMQSSTPQVHPLLLANDWFHGVPINFDYLLFDFIPAEEGSNSNAYTYVNSYLGLLYLTCSSLRAPPMMKRISF